MQGDIQDHESLVAALKQVDVVISTLGGAQIGDQLKLITAIKEVGHITVCQSLVHNLKHLLNFVIHIVQQRKKMQGLKCRTWGVSQTLRV
jgi:putative NADH-flavin reductase